MMAGAAVEYFIEKLKQLLIHRGHLFSGADHELEKLDDHLRSFKAWIRNAPYYQSLHDRLLTESISRIRRAVYDAEDTIDAHIIEKKPVNESATNIVVRTVEEIGAALEQIRRIYPENSTADSDDSDVEDGGTGEIEEQLAVKEQNAVVGLEDEMEKLVAYLMEESSELQVLSIIGMAGLGKTVLAQRIFHDARIVNEFPIRIWVYISRAFTEKEVFLHIVSEFVVLSDDIKRRTDQELADLVVDFLGNERFLLVMDDLWSSRDWDKLKLALPITNKMGSRVLITSRSTGVGRYVNPSREPHMMRFLSEKESFQLLQLEAFRGQGLPPDLDIIGRGIVKECAGLPLAIVLIGGILVKEWSHDADTVEAVWRRVYESLKSMLLFHDRMERMPKIIVMSYESLESSLSS